MIPMSILLFYLFLHWYADFVCQTDKQAKGKSSSNLQLLAHTSSYGLLVTLYTYILYWTNSFGAQYWYTPLLFGIIQFVTHTVVDWITSRINKKLWEDGYVHEFFVMIGFDQLIHYVILFSSLALLFY
jgi:hypothetical protein